MKRQGLHIHRIGPPIRIGVVMTVACIIEVDEITLNAVGLPPLKSINSTSHTYRLHDTAECLAHNDLPNTQALHHTPAPKNQQLQ